MSKDTKTSRKEQYMNNRKALIGLSQAVRLAVKEGVYDSVNEGLKELYMEQQPDIEEFKTFQQWKKEGATVRKGQKAFLIWGQPRQISQVPDGSTEPEEFKYWPLCYLFADTQIYRPDGNHGQQPVEKPVPDPQLQPVDGDDI
jgi:hypothetical protein